MASDGFSSELQGHAIKNQDLLVASGVTSLKGSDALTAVDEDIEAAVSVTTPVFMVLDLMCSLFHYCHVQSHSQLVDQQLLEPNLRARDRELTEIAKSIATLAELFKDLSSLVIDQGTLLDSVEYNIEQTAVHMSGAVKELELATRSVYSRDFRHRLKSDCFANSKTKFLFFFPLVLTRGRYQKNTSKRKCIFLLLLIIFGLILVLIFKPRRHSSAAAPIVPITTQASQDPPAVHS